MEPKLNDEEKEEFKALKEKSKVLEQENEKLKKQIDLMQQGSQQEKIVEKDSHYINEFGNPQDMQTPEPVKQEDNKFLCKDFGKNELEKEINDRIAMISKHRIEEKGRCWFFGIEGLDFDYGNSWSSPSYWNSLIKSNEITQSFCLFNFCFQKKPECCKTCSEYIDDLSNYFNIFLANLRKDYNIGNPQDMKSLQTTESGKQEDNKIPNKEIEKKAPEKEINDRIAMISNHRIEEKGRCWFFGIKGIEFDYGKIWSSPSYWDSLIKSNEINQSFCLFNFCFQKKPECCKTCSEHIDDLSNYFNNFLSNLRKDYNLK